MDEFIELVNEMAKNNTDFMISNSSFAHAKILFEKIVSMANTSISLISQRCDQVFYNDSGVRQAFFEFINRTKGEGSIQIIFEHNTPDEKIRANVFLIQLQQELKIYGKQDSLKLYKLNDDNNIVLEKHTVNILLADEKGPFRFETRSLNNDTSTCEDEVAFEKRPIDAVANFGNIKKSELVRKFFEKIKNVAESFSLVMPQHEIPEA